MVRLYLYLLFFLSGISGLIYQVVWVREFGHAFGNTIHSASLVVAIFMLGLGIGAYGVGTWADRRYQAGPNTVLRAYAGVEAVIAVLGLLISLVLPHLGAIVATMSAYTVDGNGWQVLTTGSYLARGIVAVLLLTPITVLMGGTLTLLIRYLVQADLASSGWTVALLYGVNTFGAAAGAFLTDFVLAPAVGLSATQMAAVAFNVAAAAGAFVLSRRPEIDGAAGVPVAARAPAKRVVPDVGATRHLVPWTGLALALSGCAVMAMEILWLRHVALLLGGFRAVFSMLLTVMLVAMAGGALVGGWFDRRRHRPGETLIVVQALFVVSALAGLAAAAAPGDEANALLAQLPQMAPWRRTMTEAWFNLRPMLIEVLVPAFLAGLSFPLANGLVQRAETVVGRRAGALYWANTAGAVCGSLLAGYLLLPYLGIQASATLLAILAACAIVPLSIVAGSRRAIVVGGGVAVAAIAVWLALPRDLLLRRALVPQTAGEHVVAISESSTELLEVVEAPGRGRGLITNGHAMSSTAPLDQRYMRALAHIPLLAMDHPERVLVIGFGVGNSTHAATLHPSVTRVDVADLSRNILTHASYFDDATHGVLQSPKVQVFVNDGRQHLQMVPPATYDLITLEPPPIAHAGVAALYSTEFYSLARTRLKPGGYVSQWLPAYQVPSESSLAMVRAFVDVFPQAVLLSGSQAELILLGTTAPRMEIDPARLRAALAAAPAVTDDLRRFDLATPRDIIGTFVGSAETLRRASAAAAPVTDDRPVQEYGVMSALAAAVTGVPASLFDVRAVTDWCPACFEGGVPASSVEDLDLYLDMLSESYESPAGERPAGARPPLLGSEYLATVVPDSAEVHATLGLAHLRADRIDDARRELETALERDPASATAKVGLAGIQYAEGERLLQQRRYEDAAERFRAALTLKPDSAEAANNLGVALASMGRLADAREQFARAVQLQPEFEQARENLAAAERSR